MMKAVRGLAEVVGAAVVPMHGFVATRSGLISTRPPTGVFAEQVLPFVKQLAWACLWASLIAAGMLVYTKFTAKWKEKGFPTIPIAAMVAAEQAGRAGPSNVIPLAGIGSGQNQTNIRRPGDAPRQTNFLDLNDYDG